MILFPKRERVAQEEREIVMGAETKEAGVTVLGEADINWVVQIGPNIEGPVEGVVNSTTGSFYVATQSPLTIVFAQISADGGANWYQLPNNSWVSFSANVELQYVINPQGAQIKFLIGSD
jgi:hypothetical protein